MAELSAEIARILASLPPEDARRLEEYFLSGAPVAKKRGRPCKPLIPKQRKPGRPKINTPERDRRIMRRFESWKMVEGYQDLDDTAALTRFFMHLEKLNKGRGMRRMRATGLAKKARNWLYKLRGRITHRTDS